MGDKFTTALEYHKFGRCVIPSGGGKDGKSALIRWKAYQSRLPTEDELQEWQEHYQPEIWAMVTGAVSGIFVVDCDTADAITMMQDANLEPHVRTPKGFHYYVKLPEWSIGNHVAILPGVDIRGEKGYVNFTGSNGTANYEVYAIPADDQLYGFEQLPEDLQQKLKPSKFKSTAEKILEQALNQAQPGNRNNTGFWLACQLRDARITQTEAEGIMKSYAASIPQNGAEAYTEAEALASLEQAYKRTYQAQAQRPQRTAQRPTETPRLDDIGNGERFAQQHGHMVRYLPEWGWLNWNGKKWIQDRGLVQMLAKWTARKIYEEAAQESDDKMAKAIADHAYRSAYKTRRDAMIDAAKTEGDIPARVEQFDSDPWLLNCQNGVLNLKTGSLQPHDPELYQTKIANANYNPDAECPRWLQFLQTIFQGDQQLIRFVQKAAGFSLTGLMPDRILFILYGSGANGKTTFISTIANIMGDYATDTPPETLTVRKQEQIPNDIAKLHNKRLVSTSEIGEGKALNEALIKKMTGRGKMSARFLHKEYFDFDPIFKLWIDTNHKPIIRETSKAIWDRIKLIPFEYRIPDEEQEEDFGEKLREEHDGILAWLVQGCQLWQREGFKEPQKVKQATQGYQTEMDTIQQFLDDRCVVDQANPNIYVKSSDLYNKYSDWCKQMGERILSSKAFSQRLIEKGFVRHRAMEGMEFYGIGLRNTKDM